MNLKNKTVFITGATRGIGKAIGLRLAREGANIVVTGKTTTPHPKLNGTIHSAATEMEEAGGKALAVKMDVRSEEMVQAAIDRTIERFGGIDILINNASAISLTDTESTEMKRYDLMHAVNTRGTFLCSKLCMPHLKKSKNPHILNLSPPLNMEARWFSNHVAYTMAKFGMSMCVLGMAEEQKDNNIAVNALWPKTTIATAAIRYMLGGDKVIAHCRKPEIVADAAYSILSKNSSKTTGNFFIDEEVLRSEGVVDFDQYAVDPTKDLMPDFFI